MKTVLVLDACQRSALAVTRSLGQKHVPVFTADSSRDSLAGQSRHSKEYAIYPSPETYPDAFVKSINSLIKRYKIDIVLPMTELTTALLLASPEILANAILPFSTLQNIDALSDKCKLMKLAESCQVPIPTTYFVNSLATSPIPLEQFSYPLVLKPGKSWLHYKNKWIHTTVRIAGDETELNNILDNDDAFSAHPFMLQEYIPGKGEGIFVLYNNGETTAFFAHRRIREKPPRGGVSVLSESAIINEQLKCYSRKLLDAVNWHGIAMVEFRVTDDGSAYLMEINTRFWGSLQLAIDANVDFPWLLYQITCGEKITPIESYKTGKRLRWILGDLDSLYLTLRDKNFKLKEKANAIIDFLTPHPFITHHEVNRLSDIKPFFWELKQYIRNLKN